MKHYITFLALLTLTTSCREKDGIHDLWICERGITSKHIQQGNYPNNSLSQGWPVLLDLRDYKTANLIVFGRPNKKFEYDVHKNTVSWDSLEYTIKYLTKDSLCLYYKNKRSLIDSAKFNRVIKSSILQTEKEINYQLTQNIWCKDSISIHKPQGYLSNIEFLDNDRALNQQQSVDIFTHDSIKDFYLSLWKVEKYEDYAFMFINPMVIIGSNPYMEIYQITSLDSSKMTSFNFYHYQTMNFINYKVEIDTLKVHEKLVGKWVSKNDSSKYSGRHSKKMENRGFIKRYDGELIYIMGYDGILTYKVEGIEPVNCR